MRRGYQVGVLLGWASVAPVHAGARGQGLSGLLGEAAFGLPQSSVALGVVAAVLLLMTLAMVLQRNGPAEVGFLIAVAGGLVSNPQGMIVITLGGLGGTLAIGGLLSALGLKARVPEGQGALAARALRRAGVSELRDPRR